MSSRWESAELWEEKTMSFRWVSVEKCREKAEHAYQFDVRVGDGEDRDVFLDFTKAVGKALCAGGSGITLVQRTRTSSWVIRDDCPYAIGWVGYNDLRDSKVGGWKPTYNVHSWAITNDKYSHGNDNRNTKSSSNIDTAIKNARTYLRRPSPITLAGVRSGVLERGVREEFDKVRKKNNEAAEKVVDIVTSMYGNVRQNNKRLFKELKHLLDMGHEFLDPQFGSDVRAMVHADQVMGESAVEDIPFYCVMTYESRGKTVFDVVKGTQVNPYHAEVHEQYNRYTEDMLPEEITRKLAVLQMLDSEDYVDGVGVSVGGGIYYVLAD